MALLVQRERPVRQGRLERKVLVEWLDSLVPQGLLEYRVIPERLVCKDSLENRVGPVTVLLVAWENRVYRVRLEQPVKMEQLVLLEYLEVLEM